MAEDPAPARKITIKRQLSRHYAIRRSSVGEALNDDELNDAPALKNGWMKKKGNVRRNWTERCSICCALLSKRKGELSQFT